MKTRKSPSLIGRLLWSLCLLQAVVLLASLAGMLYSLLDQNYSFIDEVVPDTLTEAVVLEADGPRLDAETLRPLRAEYPGLWAVVADARGRVVRLGATPADFETMVTILPLLGNSQINALEAQKHLTLRVDVREVAGEPVRIMSGGAAKSDFGRAILQATGILSLYFLLPMFLFTLIATPLLVLSATRGVKRLARDAAALDISRPDAQLAEESVPREVRPLVSAFNAATSRLGEAYHARDRFLRDAAHELRMPIAILMARIDGMPAHSLKPALLTDLGRLSNIAEQLLDLQRLQDSNVEMVPVDLVALTRDIVSDMAPLVLSRCDDLRLEVPERPVWVEGQASALTRVITNLLQNAMVHGEGGAITLTVTAAASVTVADQGPGIEPGEQERIFSPFYRGATDRPGHGLGLHLAQEIVRAHRGRIVASNAPAGGALFSVQLPPLRA